MTLVIKHTLVSLYDDLRSMLEDLAEQAEDEQVERPWAEFERQLHRHPVHTLDVALNHAVRRVFAPKDAKAISSITADLLELPDLVASITELWRRKTWTVDEWVECALECANGIPTTGDLGRALTKAISQVAAENASQDYTGEGVRVEVGAKYAKQQAERVLLTHIASSPLGGGVLRWE